MGRQFDLKTDTNNIVLSIGGDDYFFANFEIQGNATGGNQIGIQTGDLGTTTGWSVGTIENVTLRSLNTYGMWELPYQSIADLGPTIVNVTAFNCGVGIRSQMEYTRHICCSAFSCGEGVQIAAGNASWTGGAILSNTTGLHYIASGGNDAHGVFVNVHCNHNTTNLQVDAQANNIIFSSCHFYTGDMILTSTHAVVFDSCVVDANNWFFDGSIGTQIRGCVLPAANANTVHNNFKRSCFHDALA